MVRLDAVASRVVDRTGASEPPERRERSALTDTRTRVDAHGRHRGPRVRLAGRLPVLTLVGAVVENDDVRRRVWLADRTGGPVLPPRRRGVPEDGWTDAGVELVLAPGETRALGYATPAPPADCPLVVEETEPVADPEPGTAERST